MEQTSRKSRVRVEKYPLPATTDGIVSLVREVLSQGKVQRIELDNENDVRVLRELEAEDPDLVEPDVSLDGALRNVEMIEYSSEGASSFQVVVDMTQLMRHENHHCICWAIGTGDDLLEQWLEFRERGMPSDINFLLNLPVRRLRSLPEDTLILCGSKYPGAEAEEVTLAVKAAVEIRRSNELERPVQSRPSDDRVGNGPTERPSTASQLAIAAGGLRRTKWIPPG